MLGYEPSTYQACLVAYRCTADTVTHADMYETSCSQKEMKEGNVLFNDALNTFVIYGYMVIQLTETILTS